MAFGFWLTEMLQVTTKLNSQKLTLRRCYAQCFLSNKL